MKEIEYLELPSFTESFDQNKIESYELYFGNWITRNATKLRRFIRYLRTGNRSIQTEQPELISFNYCGKCGEEFDKTYVIEKIGNSELVCKKCLNR